MEFKMRAIKTIEDVNLGLEELMHRDPDLAQAYNYVRKAGFIVPLRLRAGGFGALAEIIISQLVSKASANAINERFLHHINPLTPETYLKEGEEAWRIIGLSRPKQASICALANGLINGELDLKSLANMPQEQAISHLSAIKGIGPWSAQIYLMFCLGHRDIFPAGDLALREAARLLWSLDERPSVNELSVLAQRWSPQRAIAARLLWVFYAVKKENPDNIA